MFFPTLQINALKTQLLATNPQVVHGSGSTAVSLVMWYHMDYIMAQSTQPLYLSYRAIGSGGGEGEIVGNPTGRSALLVDFGVRDVPMTHQSWQALSTLNIQVIQIPLHVAPIGIFANIPSSYLPGRKMNLSACTVSGIYSGSIKLWNDPAIVADNPGVTLNFPPEPITPLYRDEASGTNAVFSEYFSSACTSWALGSGKVLPAPGATGAFAAAAVPTPASSTMSLYIKANAWSIGYIDVGNANALGLMEVYQKNAAGVWLISGQSDPGAAASALFQNGGWPANPINDFSGVSLVNQPGAATWPITSMPFMFIRVDLTQRGSSGPLVQALANYIMSPAAQANLPGLGFGQLPTAIVQYCVQRALPLLSTDPAYPQWYFENSNGVKFVGAVNNVISATKDTYIHTNLIALELVAGITSTTSSSSSSSSSGSVNASSLNISLSSLSGVTSIQAQTAHNSNQISILTSVCIAALIFGIASALLLALFAVMKLTVIATHLHGGHQGVFPMSTAGMPRTMSVTGKVSSAKGVKASGSSTMQESSASML
ncbi:hypothetical protein CEUSTIGMA_g3775.t1 [Chlamydomonas eustigma]|uniref:PBP domain-containing protein n=1 Tax=Chlamydomonas eustigma TaxID=1157962 RepID=A0A250X062_9CHLO|nr:hypothetical protein CEUSTIGMA_g3775.t1 [Chlamydomonas eustigma]|eukprot:GAX76329.1 hypothetical protein CEUSTIGMA_g3775.t1 [Chlamydomonas eustigma]